MQCPSCHTTADGSARFCPSCGASLATASMPDAQPAVDPMIGQTLGGKYRVVRLLGEGGMGAVYEGEQPLGTTKRRVAIKTLHPHLSRNPQIEARFQREVATIAELEHPNTIQVHDFGQTPDGILYIVMEFLSGKSLADTLVAQGAMTPERVAHILEQVCGSLEEAHAHGIVHRDLKPDNVVLIERAGQKDFVKVLDFGIAKRSREEDQNEQKLTQQGMVLGTPPYMSPEQFTGQPIDARSDIYSLAVMTYEMLTGKLPFQATTAWEWATQHMTRPPVPIESLAEGGRVPKAMRDALARALAKAPAERFQSVREFLDAFESKGVAPTRVDTGGGLARQRTELGEPLDVGAAFGSGPSSPGVGPGPALPSGASPPGARGGGDAIGTGTVAGGAPAASPPYGAQAYTPAAGNVAFPTPAAGTSAEPMEVPRSSHRGLLLGVAGVIALASVGAIAFAMRGMHGVAPAVVVDPASPPPATSIAPTQEGPGASVTPAAGGDIPPLAGGAGEAKSHPTSHPGSGAAAPGSGHPEHGEHAPEHAPSQTAAPLPTTPPFPTSLPTTLPTSLPTQATAQPSATAPPTRYNGIECQRARVFRAINRPREAESWAAACEAKGGTP